MRVDVPLLCTLLAWVGLTLVVPLSAQSGNEASIEGVVTDPSGAVVPGAEIKARNLQTLASFSGVTNEGGLFAFPVLPLGTYELITHRSGFATLVASDLVLTVGAKVNLTLRLALPSRAESIVVKGDAPVVETTRTGLSATVDSRSVSDLPVNGRDFTNFVLLTPGVTRDARGGLSFAGQRAMNSLLVDGASNDDTYWGQPLGATGFNPGGKSPYDISQESVQEFQVNSNTYSAEFGRAGGGVINAVTKSGTNEFHGSGYWFYRDRALNANDPVNKLFGLPKDPFHFHQLGGALGGAIVKRRLFFFFNYEGLRSRTANPVFLNLPQGFHLNPDPVIAGYQQSALDYLRPRAFSWSRPLTQDDLLTRLDWQINPRHLLTGRWNRQRWISESNPPDPQESFEQSNPAPVNTDTVSLSLTSQLSSEWTNVARFSLVRAYIAFLFQSNNPEASIFESGQDVLNVGRIFTAPVDDLVQHGQWTDTLSCRRGGHSVKFGGDVMVDRIRSVNAQNFAGGYLFLSLESFGRSLAGVPLPQMGESYQQAFSGAGTPGATTYPNFVALAGFGQDDWRIRPDLTVNLGLRYDVQVIDRPPVKNPSSALAAAGLDTSALPTDKTGFAPRVGIAWSPLHNGRLVMRAGYGMFYALTPSVMTSRAYFRNGVSVQVRTFAVETGTGDLIPAYPNNFCGPPDPSGAPPTCLPPPLGASTPTIELFSRAYRQPYVQQGNFGLEFEPKHDLGVSVSYLFSNGMRLQRIRDVNLGTPTTTAQIGIANTNTMLSYQQFTLPRPIAGFDRILLFESGGSSVYHGLALLAKKRWSHNFQFSVAYTLGKVIDDNPNVYALGVQPGNGQFVQDPSRPERDRGPGDNDQRHRFVLSGIWNPNYGSKWPRMSRFFLRGWEFSGILTAQTGQPYSGLIGFDLNNDGDFGTDRTPGLGRNTFNLPTTKSFDPRVSRTLRLREQVNLQFIWEGFNVLNRANIVDVNRQQYRVSLSSAICGAVNAPCLVPGKGFGAFGLPVLSSGPRIMQLALRLTF
jgi:outer membrane receptor protein involved in Fe transport